MSPPLYSTAARSLHWLIAALIVLQYVLAEFAERAELGGQLAAQLRFLANHKSIGMTVLMLALLRLAVRLRWPPPPLLPAPTWQQALATGAHGLLYLLLFTLPITGWLGSSAASYSVSWFGLFTWPDLLSADPALKDQLYQVHHWAGEALFVLALVHVLAALKHHFLDRDQTLMRMMSRGTVTAAIATLGLGALWIAATSSASDRGASEAPATATASAAITPAKTAPPPRTDMSAASTIPRWLVDHAESTVEFVAEQAGAKFRGRWQHWEADIAFDPDQLPASRAEVRFDTASAETGDGDRDGTLLSTEFFASADYPQAVFRADRFEPDADAPGGFVALGTLTIKDQTLPVRFTFSVEQTGTARALSGTAQLDRLAFGIGTGDWADTDSIGQFVSVEVDLRADVPE
ncbi:MAG: YceI family protein [Pseudomonadota bacterium]